jgi:large subunit ribosomal protein L15
MNLHELPKITDRTKKRVGRGTSSGRGKTSGRGVKGDKARGTSPWWKEGGSRRSRVIKHLPQVRGIGNLNTKAGVIALSLAQLDAVYENGDTVNLETLIVKGLVSRVKTGVKVLAKGALSKKLIVEIPVSGTAQAAIEKAGGSVSSA